VEWWFLQRRLAIELLAMDMAECSTPALVDE
jgi:hypothetical protein